MQIKWELYGIWYRSGKSNVGIDVCAIKFIVSIKKSAYLKKPRIDKFAKIEAHNKQVRIPKNDAGDLSRNYGNNRTARNGNIKW